MRCGDIKQAQKFLEKININTWPIILGGGLPHFDQCVYNKVHGNDQNQSRKGSFGYNQNTQNRSISFKLLDFMKTSEYDDFIYP